MKRRIRQTIWGNWNGYEGTRKTLEFGTNEQAARAWLRDPADKASPKWIGAPGGVRVLKLD